MGRIVLRDVSAFLKVRGLEYFGGFSHVSVPSLSKEDGRFFKMEDRFTGFSMLSLVSLVGTDGSFYGMEHSLKTGQRRSIR